MKQSELWIAYAGDRLTCTISLHNLEHNSIIKVILGGAIEPDSTFIKNIILATMEGVRYNFSLIDVRNLDFISGISINEHAIECLVALTGFAMNHKVKSVFIVDNAYVRDVLTETLRRHPGFSRISISGSQEFVESDILDNADALVKT